MRSSSQLIYNYIDEHKDFLQNTGTCVIDNFIGMYGEELKLTRVKGLTTNTGPDVRVYCPFTVVSLY
jgi:hypothetical protein